MEGRQLRVCPATERKPDRWQERSIPRSNGFRTKEASAAGIIRQRQSEGTTADGQRNTQRAAIQEVGQPEKRTGQYTAKGGQSAEANEHDKPHNSIEEALDKTANDGSDSSESAEILEYPQREQFTLDLQISEEDMDWLFHSVVAQLEVEKDIKLIQQELIEGGLNVKARRVNDLRILLTFENEAEMKQAIKSQPAILRNGFIFVTPWVMAKMDNQLVIWVQLEEVPLELWHLNFFQAIGNKWGEFLALDKSTEAKQSFQSARMKLLV